MSEADQPNNQFLPETTDDSALESSEVRPTVEHLQIVKFSEIPDLKPPVQPWKPSQTDESDQAAAFLITDQADDSAAQTSDDSGQKASQDADWFALAQKMRQRNRSLLEQVNQLKGALKQQQEILNSEQTRSQQQETLLAQQTEEFNTLHEQLARLFNALESSHQASVRQQILIETLSEQLQSGQERIAQLERECSYTQQRYNEQSHQLLQAANTCRDLRSRLQRQQQQTLQFKAALEKSLEMPKVNDTQPQPPQRGFVPKAQPIQAWSAQPDLSEEPSFDSIWQHPVRLQPPLPPIQFSKTEPFVVKRPEEPDFSAASETSNFAPSTSVPPDLVIVSEETTNTELELESQLLAEMSSLAEAAGLTTETSAEEQLVFEEPLLHSINAQETLLPEEIRVLEQSDQFLDDEWGDSTSNAPTEPEVVLPQSNWPSPVLYPLRPPKKRKSLAAIELPSFPRFNPT